MKANVVKRNDGKNYLIFTIEGFETPVQIPVITSGSRDKTGCWTWNGDLDKPTVRPSIAMEYHNGEKMVKYHCWLNDGICKSLGDCTDGNAGKDLPLEDYNDKWE